MTTTIILRGAALSDTMFTLDAAGWPEISWNVTRIQHDANAGKFGDPVRIPMSSLPPMNDGNRANVDWPKVEAMAKLGRTGWSVVDIPGLSIIMMRGGLQHRFPVDGNHRLAARMTLGREWFETFVVPPHLEGRYRITEEIIHNV